jgi:lysophospholipase L1-like esterase
VIRVAAIGNSITAGSTLTNAAASSYPTRLNMRLGRKYYVRNEGISGAYMQKNGNLPYWTTAQFRDVFAFQPHLITIALGTNDSRATRWNTQRFMNDYRAMLDTLSTIPTQPKFWLIKPMPAWYGTNNSTVNPSVPAWGFDNGTAGNGINGFTIRDSVHPAIDTIAAERNLPVIDLYGPMLMGQTYVHTATPSHTPDGVHPKELGHDTISAVVYRGMGPGLPTSIAASSRDPGRSTTAKGNLRVNTASEAAAGVSSGRSYTLDGKTLVPGTTQAAGVRVTQPVERQEAR